ncbi:MAG: anti-sigma factor [Terrimicrobiaceae bacterium]|nr:anti-sigma factor [Terrimicrobiaceae bacterium]
MIDDSLREQAALYALDALPADEAAKFRALTREIPELAELVAEYEAAGLLLAEAVPPVAPPPGLRSRILAAVAAKPAPVESPRTAAIWVPWGIAAALALAAGALWYQNQRLENERTALAGASAELDQLRVASASKDRVAADLRNRIAELEKRNALAQTQVATLTSKLDASYLASIAWDNSAQEGILKVRRLPAAERGKDYQLWVIDPNSAAPVSAGVFTVQADGSATIRFAPAQKVSAATAFAVSLEKSGGAASPAGPIVLSN